jgi:hypothetical protein
VATRVTGDGAAFFGADFFGAADFRFAAAGRRFFAAGLRALARLVPRRATRFAARFAERFAAGRFRAPFFADPRRFVDRLVLRDDLRLVAMSEAPGGGRTAGSTSKIRIAGRLGKAAVCIAAHRSHLYGARAAGSGGVFSVYFPISAPLLSRPRGGRRHPVQTAPDRRPPASTTFPPLQPAANARGARDMRIRRAWVSVPACTLALACGGKSGDRTAADQRRSENPPPAAAHSGGPAAIGGTDTGVVRTRGPAGSGVPPGYVGRTDDSAKSIAGVSYTAVGNGMWEVQTGTHDQNLSHIMYSPLDTAHGVYSVKTEIDQVSGPMHPEAAGVFIGGRDLAGPNQTYLYFLVRADGQYSIKQRQGRKVSILVPFTASPHVPTADGAGHVNYPLAVGVAADSVRFQVNGLPVAALASKGIPTDGIAGIRVNPGLHLMVKPLVISQ